MQSLKRLLSQATRDARIKTGISQRRLARLANVGQANIANVELGRPFGVSMALEILGSMGTVHVVTGHCTPRVEVELVDGQIVWCE